MSNELIVVTRYSRKVYNTLGMVRVEVFRNGEEFQGTWYMNHFNTVKGLKKAFTKAHKWADDIIEVCREGEHGV